MSAGVDEASMTSLRSKPSPAGIRSAFTLLLALGALLPAAATAAPEGEEGPTPAPQLAFEPGSYDFGMQAANDFGGETHFQLRNVGEYAASVHGIDVVGGNGAFWVGNSDCFSGPLSPGQTCSAQVHFSPSYEGTFAAQLRASSEFGASFTAELSGEGGRAVLAAASDPTNFGSLAVGAAPVVRTIDVTNTGNMAGAVFIAVISGGAVGSFHLLDENCTGAMISPGATCNAQVSFAPLSSGSKTARLSLFGDGDAGTQVMLSGIGLEPEPGVSPPASSAAQEATGPKAKPRKAKRHKRYRRGQRQHRPHRAFVAARRALR
jgi:hypothetical protein